MMTNLNLMDTKLDLFDANGWRCEVCHAPLGSGAPQLAHRIPQNKGNLEKYGEKIIHHRLNLAGVECLRCNAAVSIGGNPEKIAELVAIIEGEIKKEERNDQD